MKTRLIRPAAIVLLVVAVTLPIGAADSAKSLYNKAKDAEARQNYEAAFDLYKQAYEQKPRDLAYRTSYERTRFLAAASHVHRGQLLRDAGKLRWFGASLDSHAELQTLTRATPCHVAEVLFNAIHQEPAAGFSAASQRGVGLIAKVPLDSGWLSGKYNENSRFGGIRERWTLDVIARRARLVERLRELLPTGTSLPQAALGFVLAHSEIATAIPGTKSLGQLEANVAAAHTSLPKELVTQMKALWESEIRPNPLPW